MQFSNQAAWTCDGCRGSGLDTKRNCGFLGGQSNTHVVWMRRGVSLSTCPKSYVSSESLCLLEEFYAWKLCGPSSYADLPARTVDAFFVLEKEFIGEKKDG